MANEPLHISFDNGFGTLGNAYNVDTSTPGEIRLAGNSAIMEWATGPSAGHGYGTYTIVANVQGNQPGPAIIFWPGDNQWPGQELDLVEITPDGSGRQYGTVHWNDNGHDAYTPVVYEGVGPGWHEYQMVWEAGKITYKVDGEVKATFTENVPADYEHGGMNNTIGFLNNNPNTSITVTDVSYTPLGGSVPATDTATPAVSASEEIWVDTSAAQPTETTQAAVEAGSVSGVSWSPETGFVFDGGPVDWQALAAQVHANYEATGQWFL